MKPHPRSLWRRACPLVVAAGSMAAGVALPCDRPEAGAGPCPCAAEEARLHPGYHPSCRGSGDLNVFMSSLAVDFLNDDVPPPHAFTITSGSVDAYHPAEFQVYGLTRYPITYSVTGMFLPCPTGRPVGEVKFRAAPGSRSVAGSLKVGEREGSLVISYQPKRRSNVDRTAIFTFTYASDRAGNLSTTFMLHLPAAR